MRNSDGHALMGPKGVMPGNSRDVSARRWGIGLVAGFLVLGQAACHLLMPFDPRTEGSDAAAEDVGQQIEDLPSSWDVARRDVGADGADGPPAGDAAGARDLFALDAALGEAAPWPDTASSPDMAPWPDTVPPPDTLPWPDTAPWPDTLPWPDTVPPADAAQPPDTGLPTITISGIIQLQETSSISLPSCLTTLQCSTVPNTDCQGTLFVGAYGAVIPPFAPGNLLGSTIQNNVDLTAGPVSFSMTVPANTTVYLWAFLAENPAGFTPSDPADDDPSSCNQVQVPASSIDVSNQTVVIKQRWWGG